MIGNHWQRKLMLVIVFSLIVLLPKISVYSLESEQGELVGWDAFVEKTNEYSLKFETLMNKSNRIALSQNKALQKAMQMNDREQAGQIMAEASNKLSEIIKELRLLKAPLGLAMYHKKMIESYENRKMSNDAMLEKDIETSKKYNYKAMLSEKAAMVEMKRVCIEHNAPKEEIETLNQVIGAMDKAIQNF